MDEWGLWLKSHETSGAELISKTPFIGPLDALLISWLISSTLMFFFSSHTRSITDTFGTGTRTAVPSSLPESSGKTWPIALAAPVEVGTKDNAAPRARRGSL